MISYGTPDAVDSFIWIIPAIVSILIRPYLINMIHLTNHREQAEVDLISLFSLLAFSGCLLVALSCSLAGLYGRMAVCTAGWTLMDWGLEMV